MLLFASVVGFGAEAVSFRFAKGLVLASFGGTSPATSSGFVLKDPIGVNALLDNEKNGDEEEERLLPAVPFTPPKGVGAFEAIGG